MKSKNIQATSDKQIAKYVESIQLLQQKIQTLQQSNLNTLYMPHHNQPMNNESLASDKIEKSLHLFSSAIAHNLEQNTALYKEHYISSAKTYDGKDVLDQLAANGTNVKRHHRKLREQQNVALPAIEF